MALGADVPYEGTWPSRTRDLAIKSGKPNRRQPGLESCARSWLRRWTWCLSRNSTPSARVRRTSDEQRSGGFSASALRALIAPMCQVWRPQHISHGSVGPASGRVAVGVVEALVGGDPVDGAAHPRVVQVAELDKAEDQVAGETRDDTAVAPADGLSPVDGEAARIGVLGVAQDDLAGTAQALIAAVRAAFGEDDELPDPTGVLGGVEALTFAPMTLLALCRQDERHSTLGHDPAPCLRGSDAVHRLAEQGQREVADGWIVTVEEPSDGVGVRHRGWGAHGPNCLAAATIPNRRKWTEKTQPRRTTVGERRVRTCRILFVGRSSYEGESARSLCLVPDKRDNGVVATGASGRHEGQS